MFKKEKVKTYFIYDERGFIKIGIAASVFKRLRDLQVGSPTKLKVLLVLEGNHEKRLHERFSHLRVSGEWFKASPELWEEVLVRKASAQTANPKIEKIEKEIESMSEKRWTALTDCVERLLHA